MNKKDIKIFHGTSGEKLAKEIAKNIGIDISPCQIKKFSCGETYVKLGESVRNKKVFIVQTTKTGSMNDDFMELFLLINAVKNSFAKSVHLIIPYISYSRQDKIHAPREGISAKLIAKLLETSGANEIITLSLHSDQNQAFFDIPVDNLNFLKSFVKEIKLKNIQNPVIVSPDAGGAKNAKKFADALGYSLVVMHKTREEHNVSEVTHIMGEIEGKTPIIFDDIIDTAGSVCGAKEALLKKGANPDVYLVASHGVFSGPAKDRLNDANFKEVIITNSLPCEDLGIKNLKILSIGNLLSDVLKRMIEEKGITDIYQ